MQEISNFNLDPHTDSHRANIYRQRNTFSLKLLDVHKDPYCMEASHNTEAHKPEVPNYIS